MKHLFFLLTILITINCTSENNIDPIEDYYSLGIVSCECAPPNIIPFQQQWKFDFTNSKLDVVVDGEVQSWLLFDTGQYDMRLVDTITVFNDSINAIIIDERPFWFTYMDEESITISDPGAACDKGATYLFFKN